MHFRPSQIRQQPIFGRKMGYFHIWPALSQARIDIALKKFLGNLWQVLCLGSENFWVGAPNSLFRPPRFRQQPTFSQNDGICRRFVVCFKRSFQPQNVTVEGVNESI